MVFHLLLTTKQDQTFDRNSEIITLSSETYLQKYPTQMYNNISNITGQHLIAICKFHYLRRQKLFLLIWKSFLKSFLMIIIIFPNRSDTGLIQDFNAEKRCTRITLNCNNPK